MTSPPVSGRHLAGGSMRVLLAEGLFLPTGLLVVAFLTRRLGPEGYGLLTLALTPIMWVEWGIISLFSRATVKLAAEAEDWRELGAAVTRLHLITGVAAAVTMWMLARPIAALLAEPSLAGYVRLGALDIPLLSLIHAHRSLLVGTGAFTQRALGAAGRWIARLVLVVLLVQWGLSVSGAILGTVGASLVELAIIRCYIRPPLLRGSAYGLRDLWVYAAPLFLSALCLRVFDRVDLLMLKALGASTAQAGLYAAAQNLSVAPKVFALSLAPLLLATLSQMLRAGDDRAARTLGRDALRVVVMLLPLAGLAAGAAKEIVGVVLGTPYLAAAPLLAVLTLGAVAQVVISAGTAILIAAGRPGWVLALSWPTVPAAIAGHLLVIPRFGAIGAAAVTAGCAVLAAVTVVAAAGRVWQISSPGLTLWRSAAVGIVAYAMGVLWPSPDAWLFLKLAVISAVVLVGFRLSGEIKAGDLALARSVLFTEPAADSPAARSD
jgi:O-antigen/teichoic acid export membrane protein